MQKFKKGDRVILDSGSIHSRKGTIISDYNSRSGCYDVQLIQPGKRTIQPWHHTRFQLESVIHSPLSKALREEE